MRIKNFSIVKKDGTLEAWNPDKIAIAIGRSSERASEELSAKEVNKVIDLVEEKVELRDKESLPVSEIHKFVEKALRQVNSEVAECYMNYRNYKKERLEEEDRIQDQINSIRFGASVSTKDSKVDKQENANTDAMLVTSKRVMIANLHAEAEMKRTFLTKKEVELHDKKEIHIHDLAARKDTMNCCLFDMANVLSGGFEMGNVWYNEPTSLDTCFDVMGDVILSSASCQYGGFTVPEIDKILSPYAEKTYVSYKAKQMSYGVEEKIAEKMAMDEVKRQMEAGFQGLEYKLNTVASSRGDYPFTTFSGGLARDFWGKLAWKTCLAVRMGGQGKKGKKKPVLFPKLVFLYDENIHGKGKELEDVFEAGIACSKKTMYPDWLSMSGEGYISSMYKKWGKVISPMGCRAFLSPYYTEGGQTPANEWDEPVFVGRFNIGAVTLNLPYIFARAKREERDFFEVLLEDLEVIRGLHIRTYEYLGELKAGFNPLSFTQGGFLGGNLNPEDRIKPVLDSATASFGIMALNELQELYNGKSLVEDGEFALEVMRYINDYVNRIKKEDHHLYAIYGTPAESLCYKALNAFKRDFGVIEKVSDRPYFSNSFHCHVSEKISPTQKQDLEYRFWELCNGGKIQYVRYPINYNTEAVRTLIRRAMAMGLYEGVNLSLAYCDDCGHQQLEMDVCPCCGSSNLTKVDRMNGYLSYSRVKGAPRLNYAKLAEIKDRVSM